MVLHRNAILLQILGNLRIALYVIRSLDVLSLVRRAGRGQNGLCRALDTFLVALGDPGNGTVEGLAISVSSGDDEGGGDVPYQACSILPAQRTLPVLGWPSVSESLCCLWWG